MIDHATLVSDWPRLLLTAVLPALSLAAFVFVWLVLAGVGKMARRQ